MKKKNKTHFDIISIGDATLDNFIGLEDAVLLEVGKKKDLYLGVEYLEKLPIEKVTQTVAGNAANLAVGASRLGLKSACYTQMGDDETADKVAAQFKKEKVSLDYFKREKGKGSNYTVVLNYQAERTQLVFREPRDYKLPAFKKSDWIYLTAMENVKSSFYRDLLRYLDKHSVSFSFNPGVLQINNGIAPIQKLLKRTQVLVLNKEEAKKMFNLREYSSSKVKTFKDFLSKINKAGPRFVVITDGGGGAYATDGIDYWHLPIIKSIPVIERTGAGDAFSTGLLSAFVYGKDMEEALLWGAWNSNGVIGEIGPQKGLLTKAKMKRFLSKYKNYKPIKI